MAESERLLIRVYGIVQGVGFRPFVSRLAEKYGIAGSVCNKGPTVEIEAEAAPNTVREFLCALKTEAPARSAILRVETEPQKATVQKDFVIRQSAPEKGDVFVSPDIAICPDCQKELFDPENRRYLHPFINCTACGPRLTILDSMPYDRERTSMAAFPMCAECRDEYTAPSCRRYHAQPVCCNSCGPELSIPGSPLHGTGEIVKQVRRILREGGIAAVKGIGGFHLCCDATNPEAVARLRRLKHRPMKPFAVMVRDSAAAKRECVVEPWQEPILDGPQKPILLLPRRPGGRICEETAPGNPTIGLMLPYAPVQLLLFSYPDSMPRGGTPMTDCFVMTSGNPSGAPICRDEAEAVRELSPMCDVILSNNRPIRLRADDSVMACFEHRPYMVRRSRGYAPLPVPLHGQKKDSLLAVGGELKNTFALLKNGLCYLSPYVGDLGDARSVRALGEAVERMERLLEITPRAVVCDLHPKYNSTAFAQSFGLPLIPVQHHFAHIASCMAENGRQGKAIGVAFDGTGYGTDGTVWGGEFLLARLGEEGGSFERLGSLAPFAQAGGDLAAKEGWRIAVSLLAGAFGSAASAAETAARLGFDTKKVAVQLLMLQKNINCVTSTSAGRLFDAVSALLQIRLSSTFEGEAPMALEFAAQKADGAPPLPPPEFGEAPDGRFLLKTDALIHAVTDAVLRGEPKERLALGFHRAAAEMVLAGCRRCRESTGLSVTALSGGVFQNLLLLKQTAALLREDGFEVLTHSLVPPNDGGIALGQAAAAGLSAIDGSGGSS